jgi:phosphohistidine phosphatase
VQAVLDAARWPSASEPVLIVGHQPTLGLVAARVLAGVEQAWSMKKGAVWWLRAREAEGGVALLAVIGPEWV